MSWHQEVEAGISLIKESVAQKGCALSYQRLNDRMVYYFELSRAQKMINFTISEEFLADLPNSPAHRRHTEEGLSIFANRIQNSDPNDFYTASGTPFNAAIKWPIQFHPSRDVTWLKVNVTDMRFAGLVAKISVVIDLWLDEHEFKYAPFTHIAAVVNAIRAAFDRSKIEFYDSTRHPSLLQEIIISELQHSPRFSDDAIQQFLAAKIYWLGFKRGDKSTPVWIKDAWDASYLGVSTDDLRRAAQILEARGLIRLLPEGEFAVAGNPLIANLPSPQVLSTRNPIGFAR
jgi:hypothetical protein